MLSHNELPINRLLDWKSIFIIVVTDAHIGVRIIGDVADDFEGVACEICGKPLVGRKQKRFCSIGCVGINCSRNRHKK